MSGNKSSDRAIVRWGVADRQLSQGERWMALACLFFFAFVTMYGFIKVSPVLMDIGQKYGMGLDTVGNVMAFFNIGTMAMVVYRVSTNAAGTLMHHTNTLSNRNVMNVLPPERSVK